MNWNLKNVLAIIGISALTTITSMWGYGKLSKTSSFENDGRLPANYASFFNGNAPSTTVDFTPAASAASPAVVHIKTKTNAKKVESNQNQRKQRNPFGDLFGDEDMFGDFFGGPRIQPEQRASGSGVLITADGYIVTNNHVVNGADEINVTLTNKKTYKAKVIGVDASSDIAVLKIDGSNLPYLVYGNSDEIKLGQWVLAIGYPLNLEVTITAGIISAKNRSIDINSKQSDKPVESFLQTDAAVNQGNSGGALVNTSGELVGINSAIASPTGSYAGYAYAIPVNIVKKVVTDIVKYGTVQRAYLGISYPKDGLSDEQIKKMEEDLNTKFKEGEGIIITDVLEGGAAKVAKAKLGSTDLSKSSSAAEKLGGRLENLDKATAEKNDLEGGVIIKELGSGILGKSRVEKGFVITHVNEEPVKTVEEFYEALKKANSSNIKIGGVYPGYFGNYAFILNLNE